MRVADDPQESTDFARLGYRTTEGAYSNDGLHPDTPGSTTGWAAFDNPPDVTPKSAHSTPVAGPRDSLVDAGRPERAAQPQSPLALTHNAPGRTPSSPKAMQAATKSRFPSIPPPPPPIIPGPQAALTSATSPRTAAPVPQPTLASAMELPTQDSIPTAEPPQWSPQSKEATAGSNAAAEQGDPEAQSERELGSSLSAEAAARVEQGPTASARLAAPDEAELRASWWSSTQQAPVRQCA